MASRVLTLRLGSPCTESWRPSQGFPIFDLEFMAPLFSGEAQVPDESSSLGCGLGCLQSLQQTWEGVEQAGAQTQADLRSLQALMVNGVQGGTGRMERGAR